MMNKKAGFLDRHLKLIYLAPAAVFLTVMVAFPIAYTMYMSFFDWGMSQNTGPKFVGGENYTKIFSDARFVHSVVCTLAFSIIALAFEVALGVGIALMLNRKRFFMKNMVKTIMLIPMSMTPVAVGMVWQLIYEPSIGIANFVLKNLGLPPSDWLAGSGTALASLILIDIWEWTPMIVLIVLSGLASISDDIYEAAQVDGANKLQKTFKITLPLTMNTILIAALIRLIDVLKTFDIIYSTTQGGPGYVTETINIYTYSYGFQYFQYGYSSASMVLFLIVVTAVSGAMMFIRSKVVVDQ